MSFIKKHFSLFFLLFISSSVYSQKLIEKQISDSLSVIANEFTRVGRINVLHLQIKGTKAIVTVSDKMSYMPFRPDNVKRIYDAIYKAISPKYEIKDAECWVEKMKIEDLIPNYYRSEKFDSQRQFIISQNTLPLIKPISRLYAPSEGLLNRNIALWQSHGWYYDMKKARWSWQRARVFQVVEDLYTQSYVLPYLLPMLENAGANVFIPRERDVQTNEIIADNDVKSSSSKYKERNGKFDWIEGDGLGFADVKRIYQQGENPFRMGTYRQVEVVSDSDEVSTIEWVPTFPEDGDYAVYVSYKSLSNSTSRACYDVYHKGIKTSFQVNQKMSGSTWVYLGKFAFAKGRSFDSKVTLSNYAPEAGVVVTADAIKFGGGMGNVARTPNLGIYQLSSENDTLEANAMPSNTLYPPEISSYPRFAEAARYWLQWAGMPDSIYSPGKGKNDYTDDIQSRGAWVNYLLGGTELYPSNNGLNIPLDMALAFHTDAGFTANDSIIGTLGICTLTSSKGKSTYANGKSRLAARDLTDIVQTQITYDIRKLYAPEWTRRGICNKSYNESKVPEVPTMLLELLSHQNFADMRYGLDPRFQFSVSRSIYKGILRYLSSAAGEPYTVQPLPVSALSCRFTEGNNLEIKWLDEEDQTEPSAKPTGYILYTKIDSGDFDNGTLVYDSKKTVTLKNDKIYSFKVCAFNAGGQSFPSEVLSACKKNNNKPVVLIVNAFERVSAPGSFIMDSTYAGFTTVSNAGVPDRVDIAFVGNQYEFKRDTPWKDDDAPGFGASYANFETKVIAGNTFDYPQIHGKSIENAGCSFVSCSLKSVLYGDVSLGNYKIVDLIFGKQKQSYIGNRKKMPIFKTFPLDLQQMITAYCNLGGSLLLSGSDVGSDMCDSETNNESDKLFVENTLKYKFRTDKASVGGSVKIVSSPLTVFKKMDFSYVNEPNKYIYFVESPDAIEPSDPKAFTICRYAENNASAGVAFQGNYKICAFGFPFEVIKNQEDRDELMENILDFFALPLSKQKKKR